MAEEAAKVKGFKIKGADGTTITIDDGQYYINVKARARRMMLNSLSSDARRVYACLELATMGFKQELAVTMSGGKTRPLTPGDIRQQTGLLKQHVTRGLMELEDAGLALRKAPDGGALRKARVLLYSWAVPREPKTENSNRARLLFPDWFPDSWAPLKPLISRFKYSLSLDEVTARGYFEEGAAVARGYQEAEIVATRFLDSICAGPVSAAHKRKKGNIEERNPPSSSAFTLPVETDDSRPQKKAEEEDGGSTYQKFKSTYPAAHFDEPKAKPSFEKKSKTQQARILERLHVYLTCDRWLDEEGRWIPLASNWLASYEADPPPVLQKKSKAATAGGDEETLRRIAANAEEARKWR